MIIFAESIHPIADKSNQKLMKSDPINIFNIEREHVRTKKSKN